MTVEGAATAVYTTYAKVIAEFPASPPASLTQAVVDAVIADASRYLDGRLVDYIDFPDIAASPHTPDVIEQITRYLAAWECQGRVAVLNRSQPATQGAWFRERAEELIQMLNDGRILIPNESVSSETLTYGSGASGDLMTTQAKLAKACIVPETVRIATPSTETEQGRDYIIGYSAGHRTWVYEGWTTLGQAATAVSYEYNYLRQREIVKPQVGWGNLARG